LALTAALRDAQEAAIRAETDRAKAAAAETKSEEAVRKVDQLSAEATALKVKIDKMEKAMPVVIRWRESMLSSKRVLIVVNTSDRPLRLLVSVYNDLGQQTTKQYPLNLKPVGFAGSEEQSGVGGAVAHYFVPGESVELTDVDTSRSFRYSPKKAKCE